MTLNYSVGYDRTNEETGIFCATTRCFVMYGSEAKMKLKCDELNGIRTPEKFTIDSRTTKGELARIAYRNDEQQLRRIDFALPQEWLNQFKGEAYYVTLFSHVMDYNNSIFGEIVNLVDIAAKNGIEISISL